MKMEFTKEQFREMLLAAMFYSWIRGGLADEKGEDFKRYENLENYLIKIAKDNGLNDLVEESDGDLMPTDELCELVEKVMDENSDSDFWHELSLRLGQRDFWRTVSPKEEREIEAQEWLPKRVHDFYDKYEKEFEENGIERLEIKY